MRITFLGTGTSRGIPVIGCRCRTCRSPNPKNQRLRASILVEGESTAVVDTSIDFRTQMLAYDVHQLDAVLLTHSHADHILGLDDIYPFTVRAKKPMPVYGNEKTLDEVRITFRHMFQDRVYPGIPKATLCPVSESFAVGDLEFMPVPVMHGRLSIYGYRMGGFAYLTDVNHIPEGSMELLRGIEVLALDGLRDTPHPTHYTIAEAARVAARIGAEQTWLIHMSHEVEHEEASAGLPAGVDLAYDGLVLEL